jgi:hypothetical protein
MSPNATHHGDLESGAGDRFRRDDAMRSQADDPISERKAMNTSYSATTAFAKPASNTTFGDLLRATPAYLFFVGAKAALAQSR